MTWLDSLGDLKRKVFPARAVAPAAGLYHFTHLTPDEKARIHLRIDPDGSGVLMINANRLLHLNPTASWMAYDHLSDVPQSQTLRSMSAMYQIDPASLRADYELIVEQIDQLIRPDGVCPIHELDLETRLPFSSHPLAPYRMDLALTYRCNNECAHCYNARVRNYPELSTDQWKQIIDRVWDLAIPHLVFTGGEPTLRSDLPELIGYAEHKGLITGLNTNGRRLSDPAYVDKLVQAGLDHVQITLESHDPAIHDEMVMSRGAWPQTVAGLKNALATPLYVMTNTTMLQINAPTLAETLAFTAELGVPTLGLNSLIYSGKGTEVGTGLREEQLPPLVELAQSHTKRTGQRLIWYTPTEYCHFDPVAYNLGIKGCTAAYYNMCVEPNGDVIPCQSYYQALGNLLSDPWDAIWQHPLAVSLRERQNLPEKCQQCSLLVECGGGCPLHRVDTVQPAVLEDITLGGVS